MKITMRAARSALPGACAVLALLAGGNALAAPDGAAPVVQAPAGGVRGDVTDDGKVRRFLGIPYAKPPVGALRWHAPEPLAKWSGVRDATRFGARCMQQPLYSDMVFRSPGISEDCLFLNVWTPNDGKRAHPVLFYIYGGGFQAGDSSEPRYDGAAMARRGIVVVTVNYRLGLLGFLAHPGLAAETKDHSAGNYGLLDQARALDWVRANIAAFGGDPQQITIGGESAGSMSVSALMASPLTRGTFARAIGESGAMLTPTIRLAPLGDAEADGLAIAQRLGAADVAALRALPAERVLALQSDMGRARPILDGRFLREDPATTLARGEEAQVPLLVGSNAEEGNWRAILGDAAPTLAEYRAALARLYGPAAARVEALYPAASDSDVERAGNALASDSFIAQSTWRWFDQHRRNGAATYYYRFDRPRPPALGGNGSSGAVHSAEIEYALGNLRTHTAYAWTPDDDRVSAVMQGYFANFILTGDPNGPGLPRWTAARATGPILRQQIDVETRAEPFTHTARQIGIQPLLPIQPQR